MDTAALLDSDADAEKVTQIESAMKAEGAPTETAVQADYFACDETFKVYLPDGVSYIQHKKLNEGDRRKYLNKVNRDVRMQRTTGDTIIRVATGDEKHALLESAIVGWNLVRNGQPVPFNNNGQGSMLGQWLQAADPSIIDLVEKDVRKHNPWLLQEFTIEEIDKEIERLNEMKADKLKEEAGKDS